MLAHLKAGGLLGVVLVRDIGLGQSFHRSNRQYGRHYCLSEGVMPVGSCERTLLCQSPAKSIVSIRPSSSGQRLHALAATND